MSALNTAMSALRANQTALQVVGNNIANANDPTYHRQDVQFVERPPMDFNGIQIGQGVDVGSIRRIYSGVTEAALTKNISERSAVAAELQIARQLESMFMPGQGTVLDRLESLFNELERFTANPDDAATRSIVIRTAEAVTAEVNSLARQMDDMVANLENDISTKLTILNDAANKIADLNIRIRNAESVGQTPNDLLDQRDRLVNDLAEITDVEIVTRDVDGSPEYILVLADGQIQLTRPDLELFAFVGDDGELIICRRGGGEVHLDGGAVGALVNAQDGVIGQFRDRLDQFMQGLVSGLDRVHATGIGTMGKFSQLVSQRPVSDTNVPLAFAETIIPVEAGELLIGVTDPDGNRTMEVVAVDPATDSFADVVARINNIDNLSALLVEPPGQVSLGSTAGYEFDFMMSRPALSSSFSIAGTTQPGFAGMYEGDRDAELTFEFSSDGQIGVTPDLSMSIRDDTGELIGVFDVGQGYEPGTEIDIGDGVQMTLAPGDILAADSFSLKLAREPDATNFLAATGLNTLFSGTSVHDFSVSHQILINHSMLATTRSGEQLDSRNAEAMANLRDMQILDHGSQTLEEYLGETIGLVGAEVQDLASQQETLDVLAQNLEAERANVSGVDPNEEAVKMLQFQRAFQAIARYITTVDEMLDTITNMAR